MKKIAIIGANGYVGRAMSEMLEEKYELVKIDPSIKESDTFEHANECDLGIVCVPTQMDQKKDFPYPCDTSIVEDVVAKLETPVILIKSTVTIGTTDYLKKKYKKRICMSPEYVGETKYFVPEKFDYSKDMKKCPWIIVGGDPKDVDYVFDLFVPILGPCKDYYACTAKEAEVIKYMENTYFGVKVTFAQEMYDICQALKVDWYKVWQGWALDNRVEKMHTAVFPENRGFGGKCYPKDINALVRTAEDNGYKPIMLKAMLESNKEIRKKHNGKTDY